MNLSPNCTEVENLSLIYTRGEWRPFSHLPCEHFLKFASVGRGLHSAVWGNRNLSLIYTTADRMMKPTAVYQKEQNQFEGHVSESPEE